MTCEVGSTGEKDLDSASTVGQGQPVHPDGALPPAHRSIAGPKRHQGLGRRVMEEDIHLVSGEYLCNQGRCLIECRFDFGRWQFQQSFQSG